jgi:hypothetical protein
MVCPFAQLFLLRLLEVIGVGFEPPVDIAAKNGMERKRGRQHGSEMTTMPIPSSTTDQIATSVVAPEVKHISTNALVKTKTQIELTYKGSQSCSIIRPNMEDG